MRVKKEVIASIVLLSGCLVLNGCESDSMEQAMNEWYEEAELDSEETAEELYQEALEEDILVVYSTTTRIYDVKDTFEEEYPGLTVEVYDVRASDLVNALLESYEEGEILCDIVICSDDNGRLVEELVPKKIINKYVPYDIEPYLMDEANEELLVFVGEAEQLFYNSEVYDECPISNWWELTEEEWRGNVYMNSPLRSHPAYALYEAVLNNEEAMEEAYELYYGEELEIPEGSSAGVIFWERLIANDLQFTTSSNEIVEIVGDATSDNPPVGFMISSKIRRNEIGLDVAVAYGVAPCDGVYASNTVSIAGGSENVSSAKLFIRWLLGEADGTGAGVEPYLLEGTWSVRTDIESSSVISLEEGNFWFNDKQEVIDNYEEHVEHWNGLVEE